MTKISQLPQDTAPTLTDSLPTVDLETGITKRVLLSDLKNAFTPITTTDANGWKVYDYGNRKMYTRKIHYTQTSAAIAAGIAILLPVYSMPVGVTTRADILSTYSFRCSDRVFLVNERITDSSTDYRFEVNNWYTAPINLSFVEIDIIAWSV